jgi:proton glutamate symport protein
MKIAHWVAVAFVGGIALGLVAPEFSIHLKILSTLFLRAISSVVVPLIFSSLVVGIARHSQDMKVIGRLAVRTLIYFEIVTGLALLVGLTMVNVFKPGVGIVLQAATSAAPEITGTALSTAQMIEQIVPKSFIDAAAKNDILQVIVFAILFGLSLTRIAEGPRTHMLNLCDALSKTMFAFVGIVMNFVPVAVGASIAAAVAESGLAVLANLGWLVLTLYVALLALVLLVFFPIALYLKIPIVPFLKAIKTPTGLAFSTASSEAALPDALKSMVNIGVPEHIAYFVMPMGYSFNLDGSTLYLSVAAIFIAQAAHIQLTLAEQLSIMATLLLTSKGVAAVPRASYVVLAATLAKFHLPLEGMTVLLGVDAVMDMARTGINMVGNCLACVVMAHWDDQYFKLKPTMTVTSDGGTSGGG